MKIEGRQLFGHEPIEAHYFAAPSAANHEGLSQALKAAGRFVETLRDEDWVLAIHMDYGDPDEFGANITVVVGRA